MDSQGVAWAADQPWIATWGYWYGSSSSKSSTKSLNNTADDPLYQKYREGIGQYIFAVPDGDYAVTLRWAEMAASAAGERVMRVMIEAAVVESSLDVYMRAGGRYLAWDKTYTNITVTDGQLNIQFDKASGSRDPMIAAIEVVGVAPSCPGCATPTPAPYTGQRANSGGAGYTDTGGDYWSTDQAWNNDWGYLGGSARSKSNAVAGTNDDALYQKYRENPGEYRFQVPNGAYQVTLKFAEFDVSNGTDRVMRISMEGVVVENALSIWGLVGRYVALDRVYVVNVTDGILNIAFAQNGGRKVPVVSAIHIAPQP